MLQTGALLLQRPWPVPGRSRNRKEACATGVTVEGGGRGTAVRIWLLFFTVGSTAVFSTGGGML